MNTLLNFSGGIDSTYCLYHYLLEHQSDPNSRLLVHHCNLINHEGRHKYEANAVKNILSWMRNSGLDNYLYIESTFDYCTLRYLVYDSEVVGFLTGVILRNPKYRCIKKVILPMHATEMARLGDRYWDRHDTRKQLVEIVAKKEIDFIFPIFEKKKKELIAGLPKDLFALTWYCRRPNNGKPCGKCHTCKAVKTSIKE